MIRNFAGALTALVLTTSSALAAMTTAELTTEILNRNLAFATAEGGTGFVRYISRGGAELWNSNFSPKADVGRWRFSDNQLCVKWQKIRNGAEACFTVSKVGPGKYCTSHGAAIAVDRLKNPTVCGRPIASATANAWG